MFQPLSTLNPYQNSFTIKVKCISKDKIRNWSNNNRKGTVSSLEVIDKQRSQIEITLFSEFVDKFYNLFEINCCYVISNGTIKDSNSKYHQVAKEIIQH